MSDLLLEFLQRILQERGSINTNDQKPPEAKFSRGGKWYSDEKHTRYVGRMFQGKWMPATAAEKEQEKAADDLVDKGVLDKDVDAQSGQQPSSLSSLTKALTRRIALLRKRGGGSSQIADDIEKLKTALESGNPDEIKQVVRDLKLRFSRTGKPIFTKNGGRTDLYLSPKTGKEVGQQLRDILKTILSDEDFADISSKISTAQYPPDTAFTFTNDGPPKTTALVIEATPVKLTRPKLNANGQPVVDKEGNPVEIPILNADGTPALVRRIMDPVTKQAIDVETPEGRTRALEVLRELQKQTVSKIKEAIDSGQNAKQFFGNIGEIAVLVKLLEADTPAYILKGSVKKSDILVFKKGQQDGSDLMVYYSVKSTTNPNENVEVGGLGANALTDLQHSVSGSMIPMKDREGNDINCPAEIAMSTALDVHGALIRHGVGTNIDCNDPKYEGSNQSKILGNTAVTPELIAAASDQLKAANKDVCYQAFVDRGMKQLSDSTNTRTLGDLANFTTTQFANVLRDTGNSVKSPPVDIGAVIIDPTQQNGIKTVKFTCHDEIDALLKEKTAEYAGADAQERQLRELVGLRFSTRCVGTSLSRIVNTTHPLGLVKARRTALQSTEPYVNGVC